VLLIKSISFTVGNPASGEDTPKGVCSSVENTPHDSPADKANSGRLPWISMILRAKRFFHLH
jgi:hypothetical protein